MNKYDKEELEHLIFVENLSYEEIGKSNSVVDNVKQIMIIKSILTDGNQVKNKV